jgi:hypothetical protein
MDNVELGHRRYVETGPGLEEGLDDGWMGIGLDSVVRLHAWEKLAKHGEVPPNRALVDNEKGRTVFVSELLELPG